jgi:hypothetical protein
MITLHLPVREGKVQCNQTEYAPWGAYDMGVVTVR